MIVVIAARMFRTEIYLSLMHQSNLTNTRAGRALLLSLITLMVVGCHRSSGSLSIGEIVERNTKAMGGRAAIEAVQSIQIDLHIKDPSFEVDGTYYAARPGMMRIDLSAEGKRVFTESFDGQSGWQWEGKGEQKPAAEKATAALRHGVELPGKLFGLHELEGRGQKIKSIGREQIDGISYHVLKLTLKDGYAVSLYVDPNSWLITRRRDVRPLHVDVDPTPTTIEQVSSDFHEVGGVKFPFATAETDLKTGKVLESTTTKNVKLNPSLPPRFFDSLEVVCARNSNVLKRSPVKFALIHRVNRARSTTEVL
jgi:outer membrane lipoprotein-sorting protein